MTRELIRGCASALALTWGLASGAAHAAAAAEAAKPAATSVEEVVVTGSYIRGTPEDAAMPVQVLGREQMQAVGNPSLIELTRNLGASAGINSEAYTNGSNRMEGLANINLRGLGPGRTLVLINGQRQAPAGFAILEFGAQQFVDTNSIPTPAIDRIEVLKDGAASTYGSDAVAGVVNFITRSHFKGFEVGGSYKLNDSRYISGNHYDWDANATYGWQGENTSWVTTAAYVKKNKIPMIDVSWALRPYAENGLLNGTAQAGLWSATTNPGSYIPLAAPYIPGVTAGYGSILKYPTAIPVTGANAAIVDPECQQPNSFKGGPNGEWGPVFVNGACRWNSIAFSNLQESDERRQLFSEFNHDFEGGSRVHLEAMYSHSEASFNSSPSFPPSVQSFSFEPVGNPGVQDLLAYLNANGQAAAAAQIIANNGVNFRGRAFGPGGTYPDHPGIAGIRIYDTLRFAGAFTGTFDTGIFNGVHYDFHLTWSKAKAGGYTEDTVSDRVRLALLGLGGPSCNPATGTPGVGNCMWLNTYSSGQQQHVLGQSTSNTFNYNPAHATSEALERWLFDKNGFIASNTLTVGEAIFSGDTGFRLSGGDVSWAAGAQIRQERYELNPNDISNLNKNPCSTPGDTTCGTSAGVFQFTVGWIPVVATRTVAAAFGELQLPVTDTLNLGLAARYEHFPDPTGDTVNPKIQLRWKATDFLVLRGSAETAFRAPSLNQLTDISSAQTPFNAGVFIPFDTVGNPNLTPETSVSYNLGAIVDFRNINSTNVSFHASLDYWNFDLKKPIVREGSGPIATAELGAGCAPGSTFYGRLTFAPPFTSGCANVARIKVNLINGPETKTDGIDAAAKISMDEVFGGNLALDLDASYILSYDVSKYNGPGYTLNAFSAWAT